MGRRTQLFAARIAQRAGEARRRARVRAGASPGARQDRRSAGAARGGRRTGRRAHVWREGAGVAPPPCRILGGAAIPARLVGSLAATARAALLFLRADSRDLDAMRA